MKTLTSLTGLMLGVLLFAGPAWAHASIDESLETAVLYVDANAGSDGNPGTQQQPLKTVGAAAAIASSNNWLGIGTKVIINPGTYRESISLTTSGQDTSLPITFQAATTGTAVMSGADVWTGWQAYGGNPSIFTNAWPYKWGLCSANTGGPLEQDIVRRREMIFVNGTPLTQVLTLAQMLPGTFSVDETQAIVYIWPPAGTSMNTASVEVATRSNLLTLSKGNVVLRGLTFQYASSCRTTAAVEVTGTNILIDADRFLWNNAQGLAISNPSTAITVQNSVANHNGEFGFQAFKVTDSLWQSNDTSYNNWRGAQGAYSTWDSAGSHFYALHNQTVSGLTSLFNQSHSVHWDTDNANITVGGLVSSENLETGALVEASEGPLTIANSYFCNGSPATGAVGLALRNSAFVALTGSVLSNNSNQLELRTQPGGLAVTNWETGQQYTLFTQNLTLTGNIVQDGQGQQLFKSTAGGNDWTTFQTTLTSDNNTWWDPFNSLAFAVPVPTAGTTIDFPGWQALTLQDAHSVWGAPAGNPTAACQVVAESPDYWLTVDFGSLTIGPGRQATYTASVIPFGFSGPVQLTADGVQNIPGASASWNTQTINSAGSATLTVTTSPTTPAGTYPVTLLANSGSVTRPVTAALIVDTTVGLSSLNLTYGNQLVGTTSAAQTVTLTNNGSVALSLTSITVSGNFAQTNTCGASVAAGASCTISVTFTPSATGTRTGTLTINDSSATSPDTLSLTGTGTAPAVSLSSASLTFGNQLVGTASTAQPVTLTNTGTAALSVTSITVTGASPADFAQTNTCGASVAAGASCTISVTFTPTKSGARSGTVSITDTATGSPQTVTLTGTGVAPAVSLSPTFLSFGNQVVGTSGTVKMVTLTNTGTAALSVTSITVTGTSPGDFAQTNTCGTSVAAGASCTISVTFIPTTLGTRSAAVTITDNASTSSQTVSLSGNGTTAVSLSPKSLSFPGRKVGTTSAAKTVTLTNLGKALTISSITITGANGGDFAQTNTCGASVAAGASCTISVTFTPTATGTRTGSVTITDSDPGSPHSVSLTGTGL